MSEHMFGVTQHKRYSPRERARRESIAAKHGCTFLNPKLPEGYKAWFAGPNRGDPFDKQMENAVLKEVGELRLVLITRRYAEWLGNSVAVAGGWVCVPDEWMNASSAIDKLVGRAELVLAALPWGIGSADEFEQHVHAGRLVSALDADADNCKKMRCLREFEQPIRAWAVRVAKIAQQWEAQDA